MIDPRVQHKRRPTHNSTHRESIGSTPIRLQPAPEPAPEKDTALDVVEMGEAAGRIYDTQSNQNDNEPGIQIFDRNGKRRLIKPTPGEKLADTFARVQKEMSGSGGYYVIHLGN
jgi:hypothetical protein